MNRGQKTEEEIALVSSNEIGGRTLIHPRWSARQTSVRVPVGPRWAPLGMSYIGSSQYLVTALYHTLLVLQTHGIRGSLGLPVLPSTHYEYNPSHYYNYVNTEHLFSQ